MPKKYDAKNVGRNGKINQPRQPKCATCDDKRQVRVSKHRHPQGWTPKQQYDIVWENCPDCKQENER